MAPIFPSVLQVLVTYSASLLSLLCKSFIWPFCRVVATSQMQATYARKTFPCFDEPAMKAVFNITVIHEPNTIALSNGMETGWFQKHIFLTCVTSQIFSKTKP